MLVSCKGSLDITGIVIDIGLIAALIPVIVSFISNGSNQYQCNNVSFPHLINQTLCANSSTGVQTAIDAVYVGLSTTELAVLSLTTLFIVLGIVFMIVKQSGLTKKK